MSSSQTSSSPSNVYKRQSRNVDQHYVDYNQQKVGYQPQAPLQQYSKRKPAGTNQRPKSSNRTTQRKLNGRTRRARSKSPAKRNNIRPEVMPQLETNRASTPFRYKNGSSAVPPCPTESFICEDDGNASPRHIRLTTHGIPIRSDLSNKASLIIGAVVQPFATAKEAERAQHIISHTPIRCSRCSAYVNSHTKWLKSDRSFQCNFCYEVNDAPNLTDFEGRQISYNQFRIEAKKKLNYGLVEYI